MILKKYKDKCLSLKFYFDIKYLCNFVKKTIKYYETEILINLQKIL